MSACTNVAVVGRDSPPLTAATMLLERYSLGVRDAMLASELRSVLTAMLVDKRNRKSRGCQPCSSKEQRRMLCFVPRWRRKPMRSGSRQQGESGKRRSQQKDYTVEQGIEEQERRKRETEENVERSTTDAPGNRGIARAEQGDHRDQAGK